MQMRDRWANRPEPAAGTGSVYWHVLLGGDSAVQAAAEDVRHAVRGFPGLHLTPPEWLHMTLFAAGSTDDIEIERLADVAKDVQGALHKFPPFEVSIGRVLYHPEAIMLAVEPKPPLRELRERVRAATATAVVGLRVGPSEKWIPHVTVAYSTAGQPARPIIDGLGANVSNRRFTVGALSLVVQWGPERSWDWRIQESITLNGDQRA